MPESSISERCAICQAPIAVSLRIEAPFHTPPLAYVVTLCERHGLPIMEMVTDYVRDESIKPERASAGLRDQGEG